MSRKFGFHTRPSLFFYSPSNLSHTNQLFVVAVILGQSISFLPSCALGCFILLRSLALSFTGRLLEYSATGILFSLFSLTYVILETFHGPDHGTALAFAAPDKSPVGVPPTIEVMLMESALHYL